MASTASLRLALPPPRLAAPAPIRPAIAVSEPPVIRVDAACLNAPRIAGRALARLTLAATVAPAMRRPTEGGRP